MLGETEENWQRCVQKTIELDPDSVTIYQMELPYNTTISSDVLKGTGRFQEHVASWATKRRWVDEAFEALQRAGYTIGSAYTAVKRSRAHEIHLSRSPVAGRRSRGARRRVVRPPQRRSHAESRQVGNLQRENPRRRAAAEPRVSSRSGRAADPRARAAAEARAHPPAVLRRQVRRRHPAPVRRATELARESGSSPKRTARLCR